MAQAQARAMRLPSWRRRVLLLALMAGSVALLFRAIYLQGMHREFLQDQGDQR